MTTIALTQDLADIDPAGLSAAAVTGVYTHEKGSPVLERYTSCNYKLDARKWTVTVTTYTPLGRPEECASAVSITYTPAGRPFPAAQYTRSVPGEVLALVFPLLVTSTREVFTLTESASATGGFRLF